MSLLSICSVAECGKVSKINLVFGDIYSSTTVFYDWFARVVPEITEKSEDYSLESSPPSKDLCLRFEGLFSVKVDFYLLILTDLFCWF